MLRTIGRGAAAAMMAGLAIAGATQAAAQPADLAARADAYIEQSWPADGPGAAVIVTQNGRTLYARGRGLADLETRTPITPETIFRLGSITKQFTAALIMQLVQEGRVGLDDPISRFFPDYPAPGATATVRQLLNHTSGIQSYTALPGFMQEATTNRPYTTEEMIALFRDLPSPSQPGQAWDYNNSGYVMLGAIIEKVTGKSWHAAMAERIAGPLRLGTIRYGVGEESLPGMARGYTEGAAPATRIHMSVPHGAGALVGNVRDLATWAQALHHGRVVNAASYAQMIAPTPLPEGRSNPYGFGVFTGTLRGRPEIQHGGGIFGFITASTYIPGEELFVAVFTNTDSPAISPEIVSRRLAAMAMGDPYPELSAAPIDLAALEPAFGVYRIEGGETDRHFFSRDGKLFTQRGDGAPLEVFAAGNDRYFYGPASLTWFTLRRGADGSYAMEMHADGEDAIERAQRTGAIPPQAAALTLPAAALQRYVGQYQLPIGGLTVAMADGGLTAQLEGQAPVVLEALSETNFRPRGVGALLVFTLENGTATRVTLRQNGREIAGSRLPPR